MYILNFEKYNLNKLYYLIFYNIFFMKKKDEKKLNIKVRNYNGTLDKLRNIQILLEKESSLKSLCK